MQRAGRSPIDVERYMQIRAACGVRFSHDDKRMYFLSTQSGSPQVFALEEGVPWPRQISFFRDRVLDLWPNPAGDGLVVSEDEGGNERSQLYLLSADGVEVEDLTRDPDHIYRFGGWSHDGAVFAFTSNARNSACFDVYVYEMAARKARLVHESDHTNHAAGFSPDGTSLIVVRQYAALDTDLFQLDIATREMRLLTPHENEALYHSPEFSRDGRALYAISDQGSEFSRLMRIDMDTGGAEWLTADDWGVTDVAQSYDGERLAYARNENGTTALYVTVLAHGESVADHAARPGALAGARGARVTGLPTGVAEGIHWRRQEPVLALTVSSPLLGTDVWTWDARDNSVSRATYASISGVPQETFVAPELIHYPSFDGLSIPAYLYRPQGASEAGPVIIDVHGGPEGQSTNMFSPLRQYFVNRGYAVLAPNVRGSGGYGRKYLGLDDVRKRMDAVADLARSVDWLAAQGIAKEGAIAVMGGSYGGFMVLAAVTHYPDLWAAGVDIVGIANLRTFMANTSLYRRHLRECEYGTIEQDGAFFDEISPIHHVDRITAPLMIVHGANDPRVPVDEAEQMVAALRERTHPVSYLRFSDEGHGIVKLANRIKTYRAIAEFLDVHLQ